MQIAMTLGEKALFESFVRCSRQYVEFGAGGSTYLAASLVSNSVLSVDSSQEWLDRVRAQCLENGLPISPTLMHVSIGETKDWGFPVDESAKNTWSDYHSAVWANPEASRADLYLVDGRFRVACFTQVVLHARPDALIAIHDFANRPHYHIVREVAQEIAARENLSVFVRKPHYDPRQAVAILNDYALNPS
jgi:hypothetical protein